MRYAIYYVPPPGSYLGRFGIAWLGRDSFTGEPAAPLPLRILQQGQQAAITATPRRYGFHATLKAPFHLAAKRSEDELCAALDAFAAGQPVVAVPGLLLATLGGFIALVPSHAPAALADLAAACVVQFDAFRPPLSLTDLARRRTSSLTPRQEALLQRWGYPYVLEEWRFHLTLTDVLPDDEREAALAELLPKVTAFRRRPVRIGAVALVRQPDRQAPFTVLKSFRLRGATG